MRGCRRSRRVACCWWWLQASLDFGLEGLALSRDQKVSVSFADEHVKVLDYAPKPAIQGHSTVPEELIPNVIKFVDIYCFGAIIYVYCPGSPGGSRSTHTHTRADGAVGHFVACAAFPQSKTTPWRRRRIQWDGASCRPRSTCPRTSDSRRSSRRAAATRSPSTTAVTSSELSSESTSLGMHHATLAGRVCLLLQRSYWG